MEKKEKALGYLVCELRASALHILVIELSPDLFHQIETSSITFF